jgi:hypothetical protein
MSGIRPLISCNGKWCTSSKCHVAEVQYDLMNGMLQHGPFVADRIIGDER